MSAFHQKRLGSCKSRFPGTKVLVVGLNRLSRGARNEFQQSRCRRDGCRRGCRR